ncbi:RNA-binding domain-containing protein [Cucurbitaria berberidis CBS 394.84]|uniref:RNA-binding domain-containing protein n=1 Tax=Cucurbitaria berberidis CBS 394.84 TaxID=1168544 RepID=A0A9P4GMD6_9PLEO|nr:RNA-binding domain-containing protein [Cucurbitaria berberidis CBS 394.84]KAF1848235.1 RNA-binding domain-containing protein [Cucurbitaria berberidis CBS 394.84]
MGPHHSLPARPPPSTYSAPPPRPNNAGARGQTNSPMFAGFTPRSVVAHAPPQVSAAPTHYPQATVSAPHQATAYPTSNAYNNYSYPGYASAAPATSYSAAPPMNRGVTGTYDPEEEARMAEWNSAYNTGDANAKKGTNANIGARSEAAAPADAETGPSVDGKRKTVVREGGGKQWEDETLLEWNPLHPRLFIGNLAGEVTDDSLLKAFAKYPSLSKARVVRDKKSTKSRSYGFVSFSDTDDYFRAAKEMQGKYIGSHPVLIKRATSEVKAVTKRDDKHGKNGNQGKFNKNKNNKDNKAGANSTPAVVASPAMFIPRGVQKKGKMNGPRVLG